MKRIDSIIVLSMVLGILIPGCEKDTGIDLSELREDNYYESEIFDNIYLDVYGKWKLYSVSGGIHGGGHDLNFDYFEVHKFGIYGFIKNGRVLEYGRMEIDEQTSEYLLITFRPDDNSQIIMYDAEKYVNLSGKDTLTLNSPCCDRYNYHMVRVK